MGEQTVRPSVHRIYEIPLPKTKRLSKIHYPSRLRLPFVGLERFELHPRMGNYDQTVIGSIPIG